MVDLSRRSDGSAPADSKASSPKSGTFRPVHGPRPAWPRAGDVRAVQQSDDATEDSQPVEDAPAHETAAPNVAPASEMQSAEEFYEAEELYENESEDEIATEVREGLDSLTGEFEEEHFQDVTDEETYLSPEASELARSSSAWATETNPMAASNFRPSHTPAAERIKRLAAIDMAEDLTGAVDNYVANPSATPYAEPSVSSDPAPFEEDFGEDFEEEQDYEDDNQPTVVVFDDVSEDPIDDHLMSATTITAALARQSADQRTADPDGNTRKFADKRHASAATGDRNDQIEMPRMPETPKWSESARHHMSTMLAASRDNVTAGDLTSRIDTSPERHRRSSAMMLLGLPALLMLGFGGAYIYHTHKASDGRNVVASLQSTISATALGIVSDKASSSGKIAESIIQKQETESVEVVRSEPNLPPPIAPDLADSEPTAPSSDPAPTQVASVDVPSAIEPVAITPKAIEPEVAAPVAIAPAPIEPEPEAPVAEESPAQIVTSEPLIKSIPNLPPLEPPQQLTAGAEPVERSAQEPVVVAKADTESALPTPITPSDEPPAQVKKEPTIEPAGTGFLGRYFGSSSSETAEEAAPSEPPQQLAALASPSKIVAPIEPPQTTQKTALPSAQARVESSEDIQLIARGQKHLEIGDISAARLLFDLAAQNGSPKAATAMGRSYDPLYFQIIGVRGVQPDAEKALEWYEKAITGGDGEATEHLQKLSAWMRQ